MPLGYGTPTGTVIIPGRDCSGTLVARRIWDVDVGDRLQELPMPGPLMSRSRTVSGRVAESATPSAWTSRPNTEDDADVEVETEAGAAGVAVAGASDTLDVDLDAHIIINTNAADDGVSDGIVALDQNVNDDLAMGAPPGAPGAIVAHRAHARMP
ncbi:hypothetical protein DFH11DRAFT_1877838 [Phellopilus nigrolimitatus]|nr:hypothetical protein DFH11DRAFT_1877838 [Phellopilus nigrolimitatus]